MATAFLHLTELQLNGTNTTWAEIEKITAFMPVLRLVELGYNFLTSLQTREDVPPDDSNTIQIINLDTNACSDWIDISESLQRYSSYVIFLPDASVNHRSFDCKLTAPHLDIQLY